MLYFRVIKHLVIVMCPVDPYLFEQTIQDTPLVETLADF